MRYWIFAIMLALALSFDPAAADQCPDGLAPIEGGTDPFDNGGCAPLPPHRP